MSMTFKRYGVAEKRMAAALRFLNAVLANGPVPVADLEIKARAAGLLGERQEITNAKLFKAAKKDLGVRSERTGFGPKGEWAWACSTPTETNLVETAADPAPQVADHSRPNPDAHAEPKACSDLDDVGEAVLNHRVPPDWERGVERLHRQPRPPGVLPHLWQRLLLDCDRFLDPRDGWAERAAALGWDAEALFGCDRHRPLDHPGAGLLWRVAGGRLIAIYRDGATIEVDGKQRTFHRRHSGPNIALPWRLR